MEIKDTSKLDTVLVPVRVDLGRAHCNSQLNSRHFKPSGYPSQNLGVRKVCIVESRGVHQDNIPTAIRVGTPDRLYRLCLGFQAVAYHSPRFHLPSGIAHEL